MVKICEGPIGRERVRNLGKVKESVGSHGGHIEKEKETAALSVQKSSMERCRSRA